MKSRAHPCPEKRRQMPWILAENYPFRVACDQCASFQAQQHTDRILAKQKTGKPSRREFTRLILYLRTLTGCAYLKSP